MTFTLTGTVRLPDGTTAHQGSARVTTLAPIKDLAGNIVMTGSVQQALSSGAFSFVLPDDSLADAYRLDVVTMSGTALDPITFAPGAPSTTLDLSDMVTTDVLVAVPDTKTAATTEELAADVATLQAADTAETNARTAADAAHVAAADPHTQYAREAVANTFTANQTIESSSYQLRFRRTNATTGNQYWWLYGETNGELWLSPKDDDGTTQSGENIILTRAGQMTLGSLKYAKGTGSPEAVVTAPVGSRYIDTAATNGAVEWIKAAGSGSTGWKVVYGDTGWRDVSSLLTADVVPASSSPNHHLRRINDTVFFKYRLNPGAGKVGTNRNSTLQVFTCPTGFTDSPNSYSPKGVGQVTNLPGYLHNQSTGLRMDFLCGGATGTFVGTDQVAGSAMWTTTDAWPSTLP